MEPGKSACGFSRAITASTNSGVNGSMCVLCATSGSVMIVLGFEFTSSNPRNPLPLSAAQARSLNNRNYSLTDSDRTGPDDEILIMSLWRGIFFETTDELRKLRCLFGHDFNGLAALSESYFRTLYRERSGQGDRQRQAAGKRLISKNLQSVTFFRFPVPDGSPRLTANVLRTPAQVEARKCRGVGCSGARWIAGRMRCGRLILPVTCLQISTISFARRTIA